MCDHGFIGACAVCDGQGQEPERTDAELELEQMRLADTHSSDVDPGQIDPWAER